MRFFILLSLLLGLQPLFGQGNSGARYLEAGIQLGFMNYSGDVAEKIVEPRETRPGFGVLARYHLSSRFALKTNLYTGNVSGSDVHAEDAELRARSLRFKSNLLEFSLCIEWNILNIKPVEGNGIQRFRIVPYAYVGIGGLMMHPKAEYYGPPEAFNKQIKYALPEDGLHEKALVVPIGAGLRTRISDRVGIGAEGGFRPVFSDDLDGVSKNGNPDRNDWYYTASASLSFRF